MLYFGSKILHLEFGDAGNRRWAAGADQDRYGRCVIQSVCWQIGENPGA
jgi:hypothetical protein